MHLLMCVEKIERSCELARLPADHHLLAASVQEDPKTEEATWTAEADVADKVQAAVEEVPAEKEEGPAKEEAALPGSEPPEVRVLVNGMETDAAKPEAEAEKPEPVILHAEPVRSFSVQFG